MRKSEVNIIEIVWEGPLNIDRACSMDKPEDSGLYQIYGAHDIHGSDVLLYFGKTVDQTFGARFTKHKSDWIKWEPSKVDIYLGRVQGITDLENEIDISERLLLYYSTPPYNSHSLINHGITEQVLVLNLGYKNRLPYCVSTLVDQSDKWTIGNRQGLSD